LTSLIVPSNLELVQIGAKINEKLTAVEVEKVLK
jgi:hypothetical protein